MKKIVFFYLCLFSISKSIAQIQPAIQEIQSFRVWNFSQKNSDDISIKGSQYLDEKFSLSKISTVSNSQFETRYNVLNDEMEVKDKGNLLLLNKFDSLTVVFTATNKTYECKKFKYKDKEHLGFLNKLTNNKTVNLYLKAVITFVPKKISSNSYNPDVDAHYKQDSNIYYLQVGRSIIEFPSKKNSFIKEFNQQKEVLENYFKTNDFSIKDEKSLTNLVNFIDKSYKNNP
jgi:hypothetical protein